MKISELIASLALGGLTALSASPVYADRYVIDGEFDGCEHGKLYPIEGGGVLECLEYNYFYEYRPEVFADGRDVIVIGSERVDGRLHDGGVVTTHVADEFEGCDYDRRYRLDNGLIFVCAEYGYSYAYRPEVKIFIIEERVRSISIDGEIYEGTLYKSQ